MLNKKALTTIVLIAIANIAAASLLDEIHESSSYQSIQIDGINSNLNATNYTKWTHTIIDPETGEEWNHIHPDSSSGGIYLSTKKPVVIVNPSMKMKRYDDYGSINIEVRIPWIYTDGFINSPTTPQVNVSENTEDLNYDMNLSVEEWVSKTIDGMITDKQYSVNANYYFEDAVTTYANLIIRDYTLKDESSIYNGKIVLGDFDLQLIGGMAQIASANETIPMISAVPEPATMSLLGLGGLLISRRKHKRNHK